MSREKKDQQLGMPHGTAQGRLRQSLLFTLAKQSGQIQCFQCRKPIETAREFSIDHKIPWLDSPDPLELFFDLDNIAFSHQKCNSKASRRNRTAGTQRPISKLTPSAVREIRQTYRGTKALAEKFGVSQGVIRAARRRDTWKHIEG